MSSLLRGRGRIAASLIASLGAVAAAGAVTTGPAQSVPPSGDCATAYPVADLAPGDTVDGSTVVRGITPTEFTGEVIGVLKDGIGPGKSMVMVDLDMPEFARTGGVWSGMSGSPVYADDGRLIGAVAYGLSFGASEIAGVTPYEYMDDYMPAAAPAATVDVGRIDAARIAAASSVTRQQADDGFSRLPMPLSFSGGGAMSELLERSRTQAPPNGPARRYIEKRAITRHGASAAAPGDPGDPSTMLAGGNLAATIAYGDITAGGVGTVTSVCGDRVVGFGHPMMFAGRTSLTMHSAGALYVQPDALGVPFKVANIEGPVGTITDDRISGISGQFDVLPGTMDVTSTLTYPGRTRSGTTHVSVPGANAEMTFYQQLINHDAVLESYGPGSELQNWKITGVDHGVPFKVSHTDRFASSSDIAFESPWDVADAVWALSSMPGVVVEDVVVNGELADDHSIWRLSRLQQSRGGRWFTLNRRHPAITRAGGTMSLRALLDDGTRTKTVPLSMFIPTQSRGAGGFLSVGGGGSSWSNAGGADSVAELKQTLSTMARNDAVEGRLFLESRHGVAERREVSPSTGLVVLGGREVEVHVLR